MSVVAIRQEIHSTLILVLLSYLLRVRDVVECKAKTQESAILYLNRYQSGGYCPEKATSPSHRVPRDEERAQSHGSAGRTAGLPKAIPQVGTGFPGYRGSLPCRPRGGPLYISTKTI